MKPDTDAIRQALKSAPLEPYELTALRVNDVIDLCDAFDAQAEENKQFREALNYYADVHWSMVRGGPGIQVAVDALKPDTEEGK